MLRTYPGDWVRIKIQAGATEHEHNATIHGVKWLQGGSGHGAAPNSGWRNAQNDGISQQFTFTAPITADPQRITGPADYAYSLDASQDGWWSGTWGVMRNYQGLQDDLEPLPNGSTQAPRIVNSDEFVGVCPAENPGAPRNQRVPANPRPYTVIAITAQELLCERDPVTLDCVDDPAIQNVPGDFSATMHEGAPVVEDGGTLVYNPRVTSAAFEGPLHDPTALLFVNADDLEPVPGQAGNVCRDTGGQNPRPGVANPDCKVRLKAGVKPEPLVLRAAAGDCVEVTLFNRLPEVAPDLAGYNTLLQMVLRDRIAAAGVTTFNNNLIRPSSRVGLHPQLVEYDVTQHDGACVGINACDNGSNTVGPVNPDGTLDKAVTYRWYAGNLDFVPEVNGVRIVPTPVEFGATNLIPADRVKQGQKGLVGALIIEPEGSNWTEDAGQHASATVNPGTFENANDDFRDFAVVFQKGLNLRYGTDGTAVENIAGEGGAIPEDSHDAGQKAINYGTEPAWYRFGLPANGSFEAVFAGVPDPELLYSNSLAGGDPATPVFNALAGREARMRLLEPTGVGRGSTFDLHGHGWQRDPYITPGFLGGGLPPGVVASQTIGDNPIGFYLGHQESVTPAAHFDIVLPSAGGTGGAGDYLFRDHGSFGNTDGLWGILRVAAALPEENPPPVVTIDAPRDGSVFTTGDNITFAGTATDNEGDLSTGLVWESDIDGPLFTGASFSMALSEGTHTITASVTDSDGLTGSDSITVDIIAVGNIDTIAVIRADFRERQVRWNVQGTGSAPGETITIILDSNGAIVGLAPVEADGSWQFADSPADPAAVPDVAGDSITAESSGGGIATRQVNVR